MLEGGEACIARFVQEGRLKNSMTIETMTHIPMKTCINLNNQQHVSQLASSLAQIMRIWVHFAVDPHMNRDGVMPLQNSDGQKQLKR